MELFIIDRITKKISHINWNHILKDIQEDDSLPPPFVFQFYISCITNKVFRQKIREQIETLLKSSQYMMFDFRTLFLNYIHSGHSHSFYDNFEHTIVSNFLNLYMYTPQQFYLTLITHFIENHNSIISLKQKCFQQVNESFRNEYLYSYYQIHTNPLYEPFLIQTILQYIPLFEDEECNVSVSTEEIQPLIDEYKEEHENFLFF